MAKQNVIPLSRRSTKDLRGNLDGLQLLSQLNKSLIALNEIDEELSETIHEVTRDVYDEEGNLTHTEHYKTTSLDKETIAVYHCRQSGRKIQIDTLMKMLNKVLPDLKAVENTTNLNDKATAALQAFAAAAAEE